MYKVIDKQKLAATITLLKLQAPEIAKKVRPGQFVIIRLNEPGERIPLTVNDFDRAVGTITIVFQEVGKTTKLLGRLSIGDSVTDLVGPLGKHTEIEKFGKVICIGGGVGTAVIYPVTRALHQAGNEVTGIVGARTKDLLTFVKEMEAVTQRLAPWPPANLANILKHLDSLRAITPSVKAGYASLARSSSRSVSGTSRPSIDVSSNGPSAPS